MALSAVGPRIDTPDHAAPLAAGGAAAPALLVVQGDRDPPVVRRGGVGLAIALQQRAVAADAIELAGVTGAEALAGLCDDEDLLLPLLLAFLRP
ncbi:MAG: hypothetical protein H6835_12085 [Planctomycetes bacterium]|nr:hypothetical protein [Planctomycetota bacterium]